jgi:MFS family permease
MSADILRSGPRLAFPALYHRNFRLFWAGQCVSVIGTWMQNIGQAWLVLKLTGSPLKLGVVSALQWLPVLLFSFAAGPLVDRRPKRRILIATQTALMLLALSLATLVWSGQVRYWHVLLLAFLLGCVNTVDNPTRQSFVIELVGRRDLMNAISLNSMAFNLARILGPAVAGLLIGAIGIAPCFLLNGVSFLAVIWALSAIDLPAAAEKKPVLRPSEYMANITEGLRFIRSKPIILWPIVLVGLLSLFIINYSVVLPIFTRDILRGDAREYGFLMTSLGIGSTLGALTLAAKSSEGPKLAMLLLGAFGMSVFNLLVGVQHSYALSCALLMLAGFCQITCTAQVNATIQMNSDDSMRGRVMSVYFLSFGGVSPFGALYTGWLVSAAGAATDLVVSGAMGFVSTGVCAYALLRRRSPSRPECSHTPG